MTYKVYFDDGSTYLFVRDLTRVMIELEDGTYHIEAFPNSLIRDPELWPIKEAELVEQIKSRDYSLEDAHENYIYLCSSKLWKVHYRDSIMLVPNQLLEDQPAFQAWMDRRMRHNVL